MLWPETRVWLKLCGPLSRLKYRRKTAPRVADGTIDRARVP
jgi:hypothetical protein